MKATLSIAPDGRVLVEFPACSAWAEHSVLLPPTASAMKHIVSMLSFQESYPEQGGRLAKQGAPTQAIIDAWVRQEQKREETELLALSRGVDL